VFNALVYLQMGGIGGESAKPRLIQCGSFRDQADPTVY